MILHRYFKGEDGLLSLANIKLKVATPSEFNDPFELCPIDITKWTYTSIDKYYQKDPQLKERMRLYAYNFDQPYSIIWNAAMKGMVRKAHNGLAEQTFKE